ncbi:serine protease gd-like [Hetaerina americana]|uniref:serine protease gd-like n=1 Tax=Hetaerina americana TaxID=62018 RepID=UPI003A7F2CF8
MASRGVSLALALLVALLAHEASAGRHDGGSPVEGRPRRQAAPRADRPGSSAGPRVTSPCPEVLFNIKVNRNRNRWYGLISVNPEEPADEIVLDIQLDKRADLIGTTFGEVNTQDNLVHTIRVDNRRVERGQIFPVRFFVKFNASSDDVPKVKGIRYNGRRICPPGEDEEENLPVTQEIAYISPPPSTASSFLDANNQPGLPRDTPTPPTAIPPKATPSGSGQGAEIHVSTQPKDVKSNEYEVEWKGNRVGTHSDTPQLYVINGEFKIKSNASLLILLIARPPQNSTSGHQIASGGTVSVGGGTENLDELLSEVFAASEGLEGSSKEPADVRPVTAAAEDEEVGGDGEDEPPPFTSNAGTAPPVLRNQQATSTTQAPGGREMEPRLAWPSPCPGVFSYLRNAAGSDTWYGTLTLTSPEAIVGIRLDIELDKPSRILGAWLGEVTSADNIHYSIWNSSAEIVPGETVDVRFFVKHDREEVEPPKIQTIRLNGRMICPARRVVATASFEDTDLDSLGVRINLDESIDVSDPGPQEPVLQADKEMDGNEEGNSIVPKGENPPNLLSTTSSGQGIPKEDAIACGRVEVEQTPLASYEQRTAEGQWPWHAAIYQFREEDRYYICGGTLIGKRTVLTAARCLSDGRPVDHESLVVYVGMYGLHRWDGHVQYKEVKEVNIHPDYNSTTLEGNLAVLTLSSPVDQTAYVMPVCLRDREELEPKDIRGEEGVVVGWGYDKYGLLEEKLIISKMPVLYQRACLWNFPELFRFLNDGIYCAGYKSETTVCNGESGDGMFFPSEVADGGRENSPTWTIRGVASFALSPKNGIECSTKNFVVFTDVTKYQDWVENYR